MSIKQTVHGDKETACVTCDRTLLHVLSTWTTSMAVRCSWGRTPSGTIISLPRFGGNGGGVFPSSCAQNSIKCYS